jgi:hypothetical protein
MKKLERSEMKGMMGGKHAPIDAQCSTLGCVKSVGGVITAGTCSWVNHPAQGGLPSVSTCDCSVSGGSGCSGGTQVY